MYSTYHHGCYSMPLPLISSSSSATSGRAPPKRTYGRRAHTVVHVQGVADSELWSSASPVKKTLFPALLRKNTDLGGADDNPSSTAFESSPLKKRAAGRRKDKENDMGRKSSFAKIKTKVDNVVLSLPSSPRRPLMSRSANQNPLLEPAVVPTEPATPDSRDAETAVRSEDKPLPASQTDITERPRYQIPEPERFDFSDLSTCLDFLIDTDQNKEDTASVSVPAKAFPESIKDQRKDEHIIDLSSMLSHDFDDLHVQFGTGVMACSTPAAKPVLRDVILANSSSEDEKLEEPAENLNSVIPYRKSSLANLGHSKPSIRFAESLPHSNVSPVIAAKDHAGSTSSSPKTKHTKKAALTRPRTINQQMQDAERHIVKIEPAPLQPRESISRPRRPVAKNVTAATQKPETTAETIPVLTPAETFLAGQKSALPSPTEPSVSHNVPVFSITATEIMNSQADSVSTLRRSNSFTAPLAMSDVKEITPVEPLLPISLNRAVSPVSHRDSIPLLSSPLREVTNSWELDLAEREERAAKQEKEAKESEEKENEKKRIEIELAAAQEAMELKSLLSHCLREEVLDFSQFVEEYRQLWEMHKLGEASYSEVYAALHMQTKQSVVLKVMPFGKKDAEQALIKDISSELKISKTMMNFSGFVEVVGAHVVKGRYPKYLLTLWDQFAELKECENQRPDFYDEDQMYCVVVLQNGGTDLEHFKLKTWREAATVFWRVAKSIAVAEEAVEFEHRDLHWGNIVLDRKKSDVSDMIEKLRLQDTNERYAVNIRVKIIDYTLSRANCGGEGVVFSNMDDPALYSGRGRRYPD